MRAARTDANQSAVIRALRQAGASVWVLSAVGKGLTDLLVGVRNTNYLLEVKRDAKEKLTPDQEKFFQTWQGQKARVNSPDEALKVVGIVRK